MPDFKYYLPLVSLSRSGQRITVGSSCRDECPNYEGSIRICDYNSTKDEWEQVGSATGLPADTRKFSHTSISLTPDGKTVVDGGLFYDNSFSGYVAVNTYNEVTNAWDQVGQVLYGVSDNDFLDIRLVFLHMEIEL